MKKLTLFVFMLFTVLTFAQGEQLYADGTATDQDGNSFEWISYGTQDWAIENAEVVTYRDGTPIPLVTDANEWSNLTTGAWCYEENNPNLRKLYNWYAVMGIHDNDQTTPNKNFAPDEWEVPNDYKWTVFENFLISNGYNYDGTTTDNKIAKSIASSTGWAGSSNEGAAGNDQSSNNRSGFNVSPIGARGSDGTSDATKGYSSVLWSTTVTNFSSDWVWVRHLQHFTYGRTYFTKLFGFPVRFVREANTASLNDYNNARTIIYPNPTNNTLFISGNETPKTVSIYNVLGKEVLSVKNTNNINVQALPSGVYMIRISDGVGQTNRKFIKN